MTRDLPSVTAVYSITYLHMKRYIPSGCSVVCRLFCANTMWHYVYVTHMLHRYRMLSYRLYYLLLINTVEEKLRVASESHLRAVLQELKKLRIQKDQPSPGSADTGHVNKGCGHNDQSYFPYFSISFGPSRGPSSECIVH